MIRQIFKRGLHDRKLPQVYNKHQVYSKDQIYNNNLIKKVIGIKSPKRESQIKIKPQPKSNPLYNINIYNDRED